MAPRRRLQDLFVVGRQFEFNDNTGGEPVAVWLRKLSPVEHETAMRRANAARSRAMAATKQPDSDEYIDLYDSIVDFDRDGLMLYLTEDRRLARGPSIEAELAAGEEWSKDNYLDGLRDDWEDGLKETWASDHDDPEASKVFSEMKRFSDLVEADLNAEMEQFRSELEARTEEGLRQDVMDKFVQVRASLAWLTEYRRCEVWMATRELDKKTKVFASREEIDELATELYQRLSDAYKELTMEPQEGKDSRGTRSSSRSSEQPASLETEQASGPKDAAA